MDPALRKCESICVHNLSMCAIGILRPLWRLDLAGNDPDPAGLTVHLDRERQAAARMRADLDGVVTGRDHADESVQLALTEQPGSVGVIGLAGGEPHGIRFGGLFGHQSSSTGAGPATISRITFAALILMAM
jgi:hypothetical protein